jgi:hypothetical protein
VSAGEEDPFQTLVRADNARVRRKALTWAFVILAVLGVGVFFFVRAINRTLDQEAVPSSYLGAVQQERFSAAYDLLCAEFQDRTSMDEFRSATSHEGLVGSKITDVGRASAFGEQRGPFRLVSYVYPVSGPELPAGTQVRVLLQVTGETDSCIYGLETLEAAPPTAG